jgi:hypothetical protein
VSSLLGELGGIAANTAGETVAFAAGRAGSETLSPVAEAVSQKAWSVAPIRLPAAQYLALGVAQGQVDPVEAAEWAKRQGFGEQQWLAMVNIANVGPPLGLAYQAWRRGELTDDQMVVALHRTGLEVEWNAALLSLKGDRLEPAEIAKAIHRAIMKSDSLLVAVPPSTPGMVPIVPQSTLDPIAEAAAAGIDAERLRILVGNAGLPPGIVQMLELLNRGKITEDDFLRGVGESNLRNEWGPPMLNLRRRLLTPHEYEEAALRGVLTSEEADAGAALVGMEQADARLLFEIMGRPLNVHAITTGLARGAELGGSYDDVPEPYRDAIRRSNIRPEYAKLAYANRYTYPSAFVIRSLAQSGELDAATVKQTLLDIGWIPELVDKVVPAWTATSGGKGDSHVTKAQTQLWGTIHKAYVDDEANEAQARSALDALGVPADSQTAVLALWDHERTIVRRGLTPTQIKKAIGQPGKDAAWANERLLELGYDAADVATFLAE